MVKKEKASKTGAAGVRTQKPIVLSIIVVLTCFVLFDLFTPFGGNIRFYSQWARCGQKPVQRSISIGSHILHYEPAPAVGAFLGNKTDYFCTPLEAELAGLSADSSRYYYPHLDEKNK